MSKHCGPALALSPEWFARHQTALLWLLNAPVLKWWFRWVLRIPPCDCPLSVDIHEIGTSYFIVEVASGEYRADFRSHPKYAKRLYWAFRPLWWALHGWDLLADWRFPEWSFGFSTLTAYPDAGSPGTTTCDGWVGRLFQNESFAAIRANAGTDLQQTNPSNYLVTLFSSSTANQFSALIRGVFLFNTSSLDDSATISAAVLSFYGYDKNNALGAGELDVVRSTPASNTSLAVSDYANVDTTVLGFITYADFSIVGYSDATLNSTGIANISKTGVTKLGTRLKWDVDGAFGGTWASETQSNFSCYYADEAGTSKDPKLVITYSFAKTLAVVQSSARTMTRIVARKWTLSVAASTVASFRRAVAKKFTVAQATVATLSSVRGQILSVVTSSVATFALGRQKLLAVVQASTAKVNRGLAKALTVAQATVASLSPTRAYTQLLSVVQNTVAALQTGLFNYVTLLVEQESEAVMTLIRGRVLTVVQSSSVSIKRRVGKILMVAQSFFARLTGLSAQGNINMLPRLLGKELRFMNWLKKS